MTTEEDIFAAAAALPAKARGPYLEEACAGQDSVRERVEALLRAHDAEGFMGDGTEIAGGPAVAEQSGTHIGRYRLLQQIGEGGFGVVWMAEQLEPVTRSVALKIIRAGMDTNEVIARFEAERQALAIMDHPNIAKVHDAGATDSGRPYFVMELVKGIPITRFCDDHQFTIRQRLMLFGDVCSAVNHAHQKGVIHRDLKPANILVTLIGDRPVVKVIDFGIAKATQGRLTERTLFTRIEQFIGTPAYMSPEQASHTGIDIDTRSDIYSLGVLLYELLTGKPPFDTHSLIMAGYGEMRRIITEVEPPRPSMRLGKIAGEERTQVARSRRIAPDRLARLVEPDLDWIVLKAIEKDRARRYETANGLAIDIQHFLAKEPVNAGPPTAGYRFRKFALRHRVALRVAAFIAVVLIGATGVSLWHAVRATQAEKRAREMADGERAARKDAEVVSHFLTHVLESPDPALDGRAITVAELLDRATKRLETELAGQPERQAYLKAALGRTYHALGLDLEAVRLHEEVRDFFMKKYGLRHRSSLHAMHELAISLHHAGRMAEARALWEEAVPLSRQLNGEEDPDTLAARNGLLISYSGQKGLDEALKALALAKELLPLFRKVFGAEHADTIMAMHNLAISYRGTGSLNEAIGLLEEVLPLDRKVIGPEAPDTLKTMHNLAMTYSDTGRLHEAMELNEQVLTIRKAQLGPKHPDTLNAMNSLAASLASVGRLDDAIKLLENSVEIARRSLPPGHGIVTDSMQNLAHAYQQAGRLTEGIALREQVVPLLQDARGSENPATLKAMMTLADAYNDAGRVKEEMALQEQVLPLLQKVRGRTHPDTLTTQINLALCHADAGYGDMAIALLESALTLSRRALPPDPAVVLNAMHNLGRAYSENSRVEEAVTLQEQLVPECREVNGLEHPDTINATHCLAFSYAKAGRWADALPLQEEVLAIGRRLLTADHPELAGAMQFMAEVYEKAGYEAQATALREEVTKGASDDDDQSQQSDTGPGSE